VSLKDLVVKDTLKYTVANYTAMAIGIVVSVAMKALLGTAGAGYWAVMKVFGSYAEYSDLGTRDALLREVPQATGAGDESRVKRLENNAFTFTAGASIVSAAVIAGIAAFFIDDPLLRKGLFVMAPLAIATQAYNYFLTLLRTLKKVSELSLLIVANMFFVAAFPLALAWKGGVVGLAFGFLAATACSAALAWRVSGVRLAPAFDPREVAGLVRIGFPMVILSYCLITFLSLDAILISRTLGYAALGLYTVALMAVQQVSALGRFAHIIIFPHIQESYGRTGSLDEAKGRFVRVTLALAHYLPAIIGTVLVCLPPLIHFFLPRFEGGLGAMRILLVGYYFIAVNEMASSVLFTTNRQGKLVPVYVAMVGVAAALIWGALRAGWGIEGVAAATSAAYFVFFLSVFGYAFTRILARAEFLKLLGRILGTFVYFAAVVAGAEILFSRATPGSGAVLRAVFFTAAFAPLILRFERKEGLLRSTLKNFILKKEAVRNA